MNLATLSDQALKELITGKAAMEFDFLAAKILLSTLRSRFRLNSLARLRSRNTSRK